MMGTSLRLNIKEGKANLATNATLSLGQGVLSGGLGIDFQFSRRNPKNPDTPWYDDYDLSFEGKAKNIKYLETSISQWAFSGRYDKGAIEFRGGQGDVRISKTADGAFEIGLSNALPVSGKIKGVIKGNEISASIEDIDIKLREIAALAPMRGFQILGGRLFGNLDINGALSDPEFEGSLQLSGATVLSKELIVGTIGPVSSNLVVSGRNAELMPTFVPFEKGGVQLSATCLLDRWSITDLNAKLISTADSVVTISTKIAGITIIEAKAKVDMTLAFENETIILDGAAFLENGQVAIDPQGFLPENMPVEPDPVMYRLRLKMSFGKQLEVYLPDTNLPLVRGFTSPSSNLFLQFDSLSQEFSLDGTIDLRSGYVLYYLRNFFLKSGKIDFSENSTKFNPLITATAELRESGPSGPVRITLNAEKSPLENLNPSLSSIPFYTETELISLMSGRVFAVDTSSAMDIREAAIASSEFIPQLNIFKTFERNVQKALGVDIVYIRSSFMQRWLLDLTKPVTEANPEDPLARYLDQSELYIGKYLTDSAFLHGSLRFREDPLVSSTRLRLDSEFGIELESPFGLINWSITPSLNEGSLVTGQELSLSWRYTY
jgi:hypothetical protein